MVIDRSKHNKYTTNAIYGNLTSGGIVTDLQGNVTNKDDLNYSGGIIYINGGGGGGSISPELIAQLTNQDAFSYFNLSDGNNTINVEAALVKDYINLNIVGDNETVETRVSNEKYLPETFLNATGIKTGRYGISYNKVVTPDIVNGNPVEITTWVITMNKILGDPILVSTDFTGIELFYKGTSLGAYSVDSSKLSITSDPLLGLTLVVMSLDDPLDFTEIKLVNSVNNTTVSTIAGISVLTFTTLLITLAGASRYWKIDADGKLYTDYDVYTLKTLGAKDMVWSDKGYTVGNYTQGVSGGVFHVVDELGNTYAEMDKLRVRKKAYFETLEIVNVNTVGGKLIISPAGAVTIRKVETYDTYYRCYFLGEQDGVEIENRFKVNDLAFSLNFNIKKPGEYELVANHYYWRKVVGVSTEVDSNSNHYIDLSIIECDTNSDIPHVNDVVAQLGNTTDTDRLSAMIFSSVDAESPRIILCHGINTYTLNATNYFDLGVDHSINQAYMNVYGNTYIGAKDQSTYINYTQANGLNIKAHISATSTFGGKSFSEVFVTTENLSDSVMAVIGDDLEFLLNQIDGNIESFFYDYSPTITNYPANTWTTEADKLRHNGDTFTNIQEYISDETTPDSGKSWRWIKGDSGVWGWVPISDSDAVLALKKAGLALDTADGKRRVFTRKPTNNDEYDTGDLWVNATFTDPTGLIVYNNDLLRSNTTKKKGSPFEISHWELASKYTDDALAKDAQAKAEAAQKAADDAGKAANDALTDINDYKDAIDDVFLDGVITTTEKNRLNTLKDTINTTLFEVLMTYNEVYNNPALNDKTQKTKLKTLYDAFVTNANALLDTVTAIVSKVIGESYLITKGDISAVDNAYANFNTKYTDYVAALNEANLEIMTTLSNTAYANAVNKFAWLNGLFDPEQTTTIDGGVVTTGVLALGKTNSGVFKVNAGINGVSNDAYLGEGIALWFGGDMKDKDSYTSGNRPADVATSLIRFDGSGYLGYKPNSDSSKDLAPIWWDADGNIHANPLSFFVGEETVGLLLASFLVVDTLGDGKPDYVIPRVPFQYVLIGNAYLGYDAVNNAVYVYGIDADGNLKECNFYSLGEVAAYGAGPGGGGGGAGINGIIVNGNTYIPDDNLYITLPDYPTEVTWNGITGKPGWIGDTKPSYAWSEITSKPTTLGGYGITDAPTKTGVGASGTWGISVTGNAATATVASKLGAATVGSTARGIYLNAGVATAMSATVGNSGLPVYMNAGTITACSNTFLTSANYNNYSPSLTGTNASGTWNISITGNAATLAGYHETDFVRSEWTNFNCDNYNARPLISFTYNNNAPFTGGFIDVNCGGYGFYLGTQYNADSALYYRRHGNSGDGAMGTWQQLARITDNVASATQLQTTRTLWGQSFNGTQNVSGSLAGVANISMNGYINYKLKVEDTSDWSTLKFGGVHNVAFGGFGEGYAHRGYYFRPAAAANGYTTCDVYIQNGSVDGSSFVTRHTFYSNGRAVHDDYVQGTRFISTVGTGTAPLTVSSTTQVANLNASYLQGYTPNTSAVANTVVARDTYNYVHLNYIESNTGHNENETVNQFIITNSTDNFYRKVSIDKVRTALNTRNNGIDLRSLDPNTWYPCSIYVSPRELAEINILVSLDGDKPSWATHPSGFTLNLRWQVIGAGWGTTAIQRKILNAHYQYSSTNPCGGITQNTNGSTEIVYLRGGAYYLYYVSTGAVINIHSNGYSWVSGSYSYSAPTRTSVLNDPRDQRVSSFLGVSDIWATNISATGSLNVSSTGTFGSTVYTGDVYAFTNSNAIHTSYSVELYGGTPYIDFHYADSASDYTSRIIARGDSWLGITGDVTVDNALSVVGRISGGGITAGYVNTSYRISTDSFICSSWIRTTGATGWYNETYTGGIYMTDGTYVKVYNKDWFRSNMFSAGINGLSDNAYSAAYNATAPNDNNYCCYSMVRNGILALAMGFNTNNEIWLGTAGQNRIANGQWLQIGVSRMTYYGNFTATGEVTAYSDVRLKKDISTLTFRGRLNPKSYIKDDKRSIGFIALEVLQLYPELIQINENDPNKYLALNYDGITAVLSVLINNIEDEVSILKNRIKELEDRLKAYESIPITSIRLRTTGVDISSAPVGIL